MKKIRDYILDFAFVSGLLIIGACSGYFTRPYIDEFRFWSSFPEARLIQRNRLEEDYFKDKFNKNKIPGLEMEVEDFQLLQKDEEIIVRARQDGKMYEVTANDREISEQERQSGIKSKTRISFYRLSSNNEDLVGNK